MPNRPPGRIHPKISTMPRQHTEAGNYLDIYKLAIEKKRLQQELASVEQRRDRIQDQLNILEQQIIELEQSAQRLRISTPIAEPASIIYPPISPGSESSYSRFQSVTLDY